MGVLADSPERQHHLRLMVKAAGHLTVSLPGQIDSAVLQQLSDPVDAWIVDTDMSRGESDAFSGEIISAVEYLLEHAEVPVILAHSHDLEPGSHAHGDWLRRMAARLECLRGDVNLQQTNIAPYVWILAASTGGPAAVKTFLSGVTANLGIAFVYVQHIDSQYGSTLLRMMSSAGHYPAFPVAHGSVLERDSLLLINADHRMELLANGTFRATHTGWCGDYSPAIDQVVANIARVYRQRCGLIVFTGMGDDGAAGSRLVRQWGGQVWVQSPASCTSSSMPEAVLDSHAVDFQGDPEALAKKLNRFMNSHSFYRNTMS